MDIASLESAYCRGTLSPTGVLTEIYDRIASLGERPVWISLVDRRRNLERARELETNASRWSLPLYGIPFAVKDNLDVAGMMTTAGCPEFAYIAPRTATAIQRLLDAGAILVGKTNMDQFATGLVGTRSPYGACTSVFDSRYIAGGSSSGSAIAVAQGLVSFALGSDTAGSGRVPAAFNQLVGMKPTRGWISTAGMVPACRTLDCVSIFAETCTDAARVFATIRGADPGDCFSREPGPGQNAAPWSTAGLYRFGVLSPDSRDFFGDLEAAHCYRSAIRKMTELGGVATEFDYTPFRRVADLLYRGPWVAERLAALRHFLADDPGTLDPSVSSILNGATSLNAADVFEAIYELRALERVCEEVWKQVDFLLLPTVPTQYTVEQIQAAPLDRNTELGYYTNFVNLLDLAAVALPASFKQNGLPFGVSLIGRAFSDDGLLIVADRLHRELAVTLGASQRRLSATPRLQIPEVPPGCIPIAVAGAHLSGQPLNWQLTERGARLLAITHTDSDYRLYALANTTPPKPGLVYDPAFAGIGIEVEVWAVPEATVGSFLYSVPPPLTLGTVRLSDGSMVKGFLCEPAAIAGAREITHLGGWRKFVQQLSA